MSQKNFSLTAGIIFLLVALGHLWRVVTGAELIIGGTAIAMWVSWVALIVAGLLAWQGLGHAWSRLNFGASRKPVQK